ncbi:hypothetical protein IV53_GL000939 [Ligilactobacillus ceti DSM 22408]|uniref:Proton-coupled thiamine transporter n=2 Tax=Ligilactobacillus TaxID=2767887 RepID=A0A0R2KI32_9LACO|nr:hypothetical protein IV53_GL000939 [Ligilactobacillus ceti DSM 22408]
MAAIAAILSAVVPSVEWFDISLGIIPIVIYSLRRGLKAGLFAGLLWGIIPILMGRAYILTLFQGFLEYPLANMVTGLAGVMAVKCKMAIDSGKTGSIFLTVMGAVFIGTFAKYLVHFYAGVVFWGSYAQWGLGPILYSLVVNGGSFVVNFIISTIIIFAIAKKSGHLLEPKLA